jgi:hypothetical protein
MLLRLVLLVLLGYFLWKMVAGIIRAMGPPPQGRTGREAPRGDEKQRGSPTGFKDIKDAEFEDITPKKKTS